MSYSSYGRLNTKLFEGAEFIFEPPPEIIRARRVLIKPSARFPLPPPVTTSRDILESVISSIRKVSEADILFLEGSPESKPMQPIYRALGYDFPRVLALDVRDCVLVEVENPLNKPFAMPTFWLPNVVLSCDCLLTISPFRTISNRWGGSIENLLSLLPVEKYCNEGSDGGNILFELGIENVLADLYFTLPFDIGIVELYGEYTPSAEIKNRVIVGEPFEVDTEAARILGVSAEHLKTIKMTRVDLHDQAGSLERFL